MLYLQSQHRLTLHGKEGSVYLGSVGMAVLASLIIWELKMKG